MSGFDFMPDIPNPASLFTTKVSLVVIGVLALAIGVQQVRVANLQADVARVEQQRDAEKTARMAAAVEHGRKILKLQGEHAEAQATKEKENATKIAKLEADRRAGAATVAGLRNQLAAFTSGDRRPGETDAAAAERYHHRLVALAGLLDEGFGLVEEGRHRVEQRDIEVANLINQINIDRGTCQKVP